MRYELAHRGRLKLNPNNPKEITDHDVEKMVVYLQTHGFRDPVEARLEDGLVVAGHRRLLAADRLHLDIIPTIWHEGMTDEEAVAYTIAHSRSEKDVKFNRALLSDQVAGLPEDFVAGLGFDETELVALFDLDRGAESGDGDREAEDGARSHLVGGETWTIGPVSFRVFKGLSNSSLLAAEGYIRKIMKMLKKPAHLEGDQGALFEAVMKERADAAQDLGSVLVNEVVADPGHAGVDPVHDRGSADELPAGDRPSVGRRRHRARVEPEQRTAAAGRLPAVDRGAKGGPPARRRNRPGK